MPRMRPKPRATPDDLAFGVHACAAALAQGVARSLIALEGASNPRVSELVDAARSARVDVSEAPLARLDELTGGGVHQGVLVRLRALPTIDLARTAAEASGPALALILDGITDPQNVGAVLRVGVAVGAAAVVLPPRRGALLTPGVHRASAGLSFTAPVAAPQNLARAVRQLKEGGFWVVAAALGEGAAPATAFDWPERTALILGSEERGVGRLLTEQSDYLVRLPMDPRVESLNVSVACGALAYLWRRQWPAAG